MELHHMYILWFQTWVNVQETGTVHYYLKSAGNKYLYI